MAQSWNNGGSGDSLTPSTRLLNQKLGTSPAPRRLTPSEIELLRASKRELAAQAFAQLAGTGHAAVGVAEPVPPYAASCNDDPKA